MITLHMAVEGVTEQLFVRQVIAPHLAGFGVYVGRVELIAHGKRHGATKRGGAIGGYQPIAKDLKSRLKEDSRPTVWCTTMIDLYRLPRDFPGYEQAACVRDSYQRVAALEAAFESNVGSSQFIAYLQLHEFEALLFADPPKFGQYNPAWQAEAERLQAVLERFQGNPELIDDGESTAPSKRIGQEIARYVGAKTTVGPAVAALISLPVIRSRCPHFDQWLRKLENLGAAPAGN